MKNLFKFFLNLLPRPWTIRLSYLIRPILAWFYKGDRYTDPIDGRHFRSFLPYGYEKTRENVLSPSTLSLERHRLLWLYLAAQTDFFRAELKVLHMAPEQCFLPRFKSLKNLKITTCDLYSPIADVKADITNLPFAEATFDFILCNHVLEHIPDDAKAMRELYRVMKPGATAILQVPLDRERLTTYEDFSIIEPQARAEAFGQYDHVRVYGLDYKSRLENAGFNVDLNDFVSTLSVEEVNRYRLDARELIPIARKPLS